MAIEQSVGRGIRLVIDERGFKHGIREINHGFLAMRQTLDNMGIGVVMTSRRKKIPKWDAKKPPHGAAIANFLRVKGKDPFSYDPAYLQEVGDFVADEVEDAMGFAYRTAKPQTDRIKRLLKAAAVDMAERVQQDLDDRKLGEKKIPRASQFQPEPWMDERVAEQMRKRKARAEKWFYWRLRWLQKRGVVTKDHGFPPPYGIFSARFYDGIKGIWKLGRRAT